MADTHSHRILRTCSVACLCLLIWAAVGTAETNRIVIRVNDRIATLFDYQQRRNDRIDSIRRSPQLSPKQRQELLSKAGEATLKEIYEELLVLSRADQLDVRVSPADIDRAMVQMKESNGIKTEAEFQRALQSFGMTIETYRSQISTNLMIREVMGREVNSKIDLEEEDLRRYYRSHPEEFEIPSQINLKEVVILRPDDADVQQTAALASELRRKLVADEDFAAVVGPYAESGSSSNAIELGWVRRGDLEPSLDAVAWKLEVGEISEPILARGGLHLMQLVDRKELEIKPFKEVEDSIRSRQEEKKYQEALGTFLEDLEAQSHIEVNPPPETPGVTAEFLSNIQDNPMKPLTIPQVTVDQGVAEPDGAATPPSDTSTKTPESS